ncbi:hypothetical protein SISSUDRAFT_1106590 [Sistotremastrum suecicum HHB10207 ss-3]|uniref:Thioesterase domain-containing protein n=1 Tax=Sistotremastrum suecicum HHB10207 ss-3 TaxID=1314776 RepID=A0A166CJE4_9AGAM|nr:hypothetical protein SISSUDRAFT_1106590 [Sistotremastrum suecicum HHB10207 ss-3]
MAIPSDLMKAFKSQDKSALDIASIKGNAPDAIKTHIAGILFFFIFHKESFAHSVGKRIKVVEVDAEDPNSGGNVNQATGEGQSRRRATVICECTVEQDMVNGAGNMHGGCTGYLMDICTSFPIAAATKNKDGSYGTSGVSQSLNIVYHAPAPVGTQLRIVSSTVAVGGRVMTARCEVQFGPEMLDHPLLTVLSDRFGIKFSIVLWRPVFTPR